MTEPADAIVPRPWYREPWPWVLIAIPLATVIASGITLWLVLTHPDPLVVQDQDYQRIHGELHAQRTAPAPQPDPARGAGND